MNDKILGDEEMRLKRINTWIAAIGAVGVAASIWFGFHQLATQVRQQWTAKFYDEKLSLYSRATEAAARLAALKAADGTDAELRAGTLQFRTLFWGPMCVTEGRDVEQAMLHFARGLDAKVSAKSLEQLSLYLAHVCRNEAHALYIRDARPASHYGTNEKILAAMDGLLPPRKEP